MKIEFYKYQGTGNDFVIIDNYHNDIKALSTQQIKTICNRHFGIGADGLMLLGKKDGYDFEMIYYNADGNESTMCGNGGRCLVKFASKMGIKRSTYHFTAFDGDHQAEIDDSGIVRLKMNDVHKIKMAGSDFLIDTGSPHYIQLVGDASSVNVYNEGRAIRNSREFVAEGINVNFVSRISDDEIEVRTYERGVEDETYSCGTGVTACALVCYHNDNGFNRVEIQTKGGQLSVEYDKLGENFKNVWLNGPAVKVFEGTVDLSNSVA